MASTRRSQSNRLVKNEHTFNPDTLDWVLKEYIVWMKVTRKKRTIEHAESYLKKFIGWCKQHGVENIHDLQRSHIMEWQLHLLEHYKSRATVWSINCDVRAFLNWCVREEIIKSPPFKDGDFISKPKPNPKPLRVDDVQKLIDATDGKGWIAARDRALVVTLLYTGVRSGELVQMKVGDLDQQSFTVIQKGDRQHVVHLNAECIHEIRRYLRLFMRDTGRRLTPDDALWQSTRGEPLTGNALRLIMKRLSEKAGIHVWAHRLRATSATIRLALGASTELVKEQLGHSSLESLQAYVKLAEEDKARLLDETSPLKVLRGK